MVNDACQRNWQPLEVEFWKTPSKFVRAWEGMHQSEISICPDIEEN